jgi:acyl-CoA reductase-like NAD-dependent aldehyde dehydrogenase
MQPIFINGAWTEAGTAASLTIANPATCKSLDNVADCDGGDVARAVDAARDALPAWRSTRSRAALLGAIAERLREDRREIASLLSRETGKPICESYDCVEGTVRIFAAAAASAAASKVASDVSTGVVAAIASYHFPLLGFALTSAAAIAAGHCVVFKPALQAPLSSIRLAQACGVLPPGVLNLITGGEDTGRALVMHAHVARVRFSGALEDGRRVAAEARGKRVDLLAPGRGAFIVCADADLERAVPSIAWERLNNAGQSSGSPQHLYVERSIAAELADRLHQCVGFLDVDDPAKPPTDIGPLISLAAANRVEDQVGRTLRAGARLILGGRRFRPSGLAGHFFQPTLLANVRPGSVPTAEEILGPVVTITPVEGLDEGLRLTIESGCAGASVYSTDAARAERALESESSCIFRINDPADPLTGMTLLALPAAMREMIRGDEPRRVSAAASIAIKPWWFPYLERSNI